MSKIYLIGNASSNDELTVTQFIQAELELKRDGFSVVNIMYEFDWHNKPVKEALTTRLSLLLTCTHAYILPNWEQDEFAKIELVTAKTAGLKLSIALGTIQPYRLVFFNP